MPVSATYLKLLLTLTSLWMLANIAFNLIVDPFNAHQWVHRAGFNTIKISANLYERIATPLIVARAQPGRLYLGTSRSEIALDGESAALASQSPETTLNLSMSSASIYEIMLLFQHAIQVAPVKQAVIGLEIHAFTMPTPGRSEIDAYVDRDWQRQRNTGYRLRQFRDSLLALDVTTNSVETLEKQAEKYRLNTADGRFLGAKTVDEALAKMSHRDYFKRWIAEWVKGTWTPCPSGEVVFRNSDRFDSFARFRDILELAAEHLVDLKLYISPSHVLLMDAMVQSGVWSSSETWKIEMVRIVEQVNSEYGSNFSIVDFESVDAFSTEAIPENQQQRMTWFFDPVHITPAFGDVILARLYDGQVAAGVGVTLQQSQLENQLGELREDLQRYKRDHPEEDSFVREQVELNVPLRKGASSCAESGTPD